MESTPHQRVSLERAIFEPYCLVASRSLMNHNDGGGGGGGSLEDPDAPKIPRALDAPSREACGGGAAESGDPIRSSWSLHASYLFSYELQPDQLDPMIE
ncbi:hypothetical protein Tco_0549233 [Tanacetum coccineum]